MLDLTQISVIFADHRFAFGRTHHFSPCDKKSFSTASFPILACSSLISASVSSAFLTLSENTPVRPSIACRFHVATCVGWILCLATISCTVLSPRSASSAAVDLNLPEKLRLFVTCASCRHCRIHFSSLSSFAGPLQFASRNLGFQTLEPPRQ